MDGNTNLSLNIMYRLSRLPRKVLITTDEVIAQAPVDGNPEIGNLLSAIQIAEERFIKPALQKELYYDIRNQKNVVVTLVNKSYMQGLVGTQLAIGDIINAIEFVSTQWYKELWNEHLWKLTAECVMYIASPTNFSRYTASGEMENNPKSITEGQAAASVDLGKMKWKMDKLMMDRIDPLLAGMREWLFDNRSNFPGYANDNHTGISVQRKTGWVHGIYDRRKTTCSKDV